ncbi:MAG: hypothetical protein EXR69_03545 [Myxococcales bacterium]|nr:hypothetical protein [Myxococcales bacterium]
MTRVAVYAGTHWIVGLLNTDGRRLNELANDRANEFLSLTDARVHREPDLSRPLTLLPRVVVPKSAVLLLALLEAQHEAPEKRRTYMQKKLSFPVFVTVAGTEVIGTMHLTTRIDPVALLARLAIEGSAFFAVADAEVPQLPPLGGAEIAPVVLVARAAVTGCYLADTPV